MRARTRPTLLVWTAAIDIILSHVVIRYSEMIIVRLIPNIKGGDLVRLRYQSQLDVWIGSSLEYIDFRGSSASPRRWVIFTFTGAL